MIDKVCLPSVIKWLISISSYLPNFLIQQGAPNCALAEHVPMAVIFEAHCIIKHMFKFLQCEIKAWYAEISFQKAIILSYLFNVSNICILTKPGWFNVSWSNLFVLQTLTTWSVWWPPDWSVCWLPGKYEDYLACCKKYPKDGAIQPPMMHLWNIYWFFLVDWKLPFADIK